MWQWVYGGEGHVSGGSVLGTGLGLGERTGVREGWRGSEWKGLRVGREQDGVANRPKDCAAALRRFVGSNGRAVSETAL